MPVLPQVWWGLEKASPPPYQTKGSAMPFRINHIHIKATDPRKAADWWGEAFGFKVLSDDTRPFGDRFVRCQADGMLVSFSNARTGETLAPAGSDGARWGL